MKMKVIFQCVRCFKCRRALTPASLVLVQGDFYCSNHNSVINNPDGWIENLVQNEIASIQERIKDISTADKTDSHLEEKESLKRSQSEKRNTAEMAAKLASVLDPTKMLLKSPLKPASLIEEPLQDPLKSEEAPERKSFSSKFKTLFKKEKESSLKSSKSIEVDVTPPPKTLGKASAIPKVDLNEILDAKFKLKLKNENEIISPISPSSECSPTMATILSPQSMIEVLEEENLLPLERPAVLDECLNEKLVESIEESWKLSCDLLSLLSISEHSLEQIASLFEQISQQNQMFLMLVKQKIPSTNTLEKVFSDLDDKGVETLNMIRMELSSSSSAFIEKSELEQQFQTSLRVMSDAVRLYCSADRILAIATDSYRIEAVPNLFAEAKRLSLFQKKTEDQSSLFYILDQMDISGFSYRKYFLPHSNNKSNLEHVNYLYCDDKYGPLIISIMKEEKGQEKQQETSSSLQSLDLTECNLEERGFLNLGSESQEHADLYRIIIRTKQASLPVIS